MKVNRQKLYHRGADFFALDGNAVMKLRREAAIEACLDAASQGLRCHQDRGRTLVRRYIRSPNGCDLGRGRSAG